jgi:hypothetical protein
MEQESKMSVMKWVLVGMLMFPVVAFIVWFVILVDTLPPTGKCWGGAKKRVDR